VICSCDVRRARTLRLAATAAIALYGCASFASAQTPTASDVAVKAAFIFNFTKFTEWPALPSGAAIVACVTGDDAVAAALVQTVGGKTISGHTVEVRNAQDRAMWRDCHVLFIADAAARRGAGGLDGITGLPVLTVSDRSGFSRAGGIIEFYLEDERMRFAINVDAVERAGLHLSSRLLQLARIVRDDRVDQRERRCRPAP
jgi:uncharacterized protein DUF4154